MNSSIKALRKLGVRTRLIDLPCNEKDLLELPIRLKEGKQDFLFTIDNTGDQDCHKWLPDPIEQLQGGA